ISLKRSTLNLQISTSSPADYPICGERRAFTASCSSSALRSPSRRWPSTWSSGRDHQVRDGAPSCATTRRTSLPWICSLSRALALTCSITLIIVRLDRRNLIWVNVTTNPTAEWIARQLSEAFPWHEAPHYVIRDRDRIYGTVVTRRLRAMGIRDKPSHRPRLGRMASLNG